ncbi:small integral membrane protein 19 isoform X2 [Python bivittatus]|uniref:Small integral membrane protein 19 n=1 Tax=Python bivittatus TaxID=176946 RepID=A0A9F5IPG1_PYTBI|nr:small integral membrane protein 19 isoform X2 [Python bivittatus]
MPLPNSSSSVGMSFPRESQFSAVESCDIAKASGNNCLQTFRNKRKIMRIFTLPPTIDIPSEPNFYDSVKKVRLRQQLEMYSIARKYDHQQQPQKQTDSVQLLVE